MKRYILSILLLLFACVSYGQIKPPQQTDTLYVSSVKYNYAEIRKENWPCEVIYKSTTSFKIGEDEFLIKDASKFGQEVEFRVTDKEECDTYVLIYEEGYYSKEIHIRFSGYEFVCQTNLPSEVRYKAVAKLSGRTVNGSLPTFSSNKTGKVVVQIWVDNYGSVQKAVVETEASTITDKELLGQARRAALNSHFNMSSDAPALQMGTIVYENIQVDTENTPEEYFDLDVKPSFQGGDANYFSNWVNQRLVYPKKAKKNGSQGRVTLSFTIAKDGSVTDVKVIKGVDESLDKEAVRVVSSSPKWTPAQKDGVPVAVTYTFPVIFQTR